MEMKSLGTINKANEKFTNDSMDDVYNNLIAAVEKKDGYAVCGKDKRPTFLIEGIERTINSVCLNACDESSPLKAIDSDGECWDVDDYLSAWQIQTLLEVI